MNRLNIITLGVNDMVRSHEFYRDGLGFKTAVRGDEDNPAIIFFQNEGSKIALYPLPLLAEDISSEISVGTTKGFSGMTLAYVAKSVDEVDEVLRKASLAGGKIVKPAQLVEWGGYSGYFQDPDGYYWEVAYSEEWEFDESNMVVIND